MTEASFEAVDELPAVVALRALSVFTADQAGAYREHFDDVAHALGEDVKTKLAIFIASWAKSAKQGVVVLTGNAGTGKTAAAEAYCKALGAELPTKDALITVAPKRKVLKDLSGLPNARARADAMKKVLKGASKNQFLVCANEGVLRDAFSDLEQYEAISTLEAALRHGAYEQGELTIVNVNRQRPTGAGMWNAVVDYVSRSELWFGCDGCPFELGGCPMRSNAEQLRRPEVREQLRALIRVASGEAVPTLREVLAILAWSIVGDLTCSDVRKRNRDLGKEAFTASHGYFSRMLGGGLNTVTAERSPLLTGMLRTGLGDISDLQVDGWLRDTNGAPPAIRVIAGCPTEEFDLPTRRPRLTGTASPLDRVQTTQHVMTFYELGEMVSTDEDSARVDDGLTALVRGDSISNSPAQSLWRQRVYFEGSGDLGGYARAGKRLLAYSHTHELFELAAKAATGADTILELTELVRGLNFLVTGFASADEGLVIPDPACLFARDPGAFRPASPSLVHNLLSIERLSITVPDRGLTEEVLDVDHIDVELMVKEQEQEIRLRVSPRMYEAIREAADYRGPVGQGVAEMNDLRGFYGRLAKVFEPTPDMRVAAPKSNPPGLIKITLPRFVSSGGEER